MAKAHVPAWKKLGLKLKYAKDEPSNFPLASPTTNGARKTKFDDIDDHQTPTPSINGSYSKLSRDSPPPSKKPKRVSFSTDTKVLDGDTARSALPSEVTDQLVASRQSRTNQTKPTQPKAPTPPSKHKPNDALEYLRQYYYSNPTWKFSKNRETWILKHALDTNYIPANLNLPLAQYIYGLKSENARQRLRSEAETARESATTNGEEITERETLNDQQRRELSELLETFPASLQTDDSAFSSELESTHRSALLLCALGPAHKFNADRKAMIAEEEMNDDSAPATKSTPKQPQPPPVNRKKKNRTAVVDFSSSSSESSGEDENEDDTNHAAGNDETSSSGSSSSEADSHSDSSSDSDSDESMEEEKGT